MRSRARSFVALGLLPLASAGVVLVSACADDASEAPPTAASDAGGADADGRRDDATAPRIEDAGTDAEAPLANATEVEPNNGATETETNAMTVPGRMTAAIDPPNDVDIFAVQISAGELWQWTLTPSSAELAPHLAVFDIAPNQMNPNRVVAAAAGATATLDHFVLRNGTFVAGVRDARNVPTPTGKGGAGHGYTLQAVKRPVAPVSVTFPSTKIGRLSAPGALDFYTFTATKGTTFGIVIKAERKAQPSTLDSRLSLFHLPTNKAIITNDNAGTSTDSQVGGLIPEDGAYLAIVEHEGDDPSDLSYEIVFQTTQPL